MKYRIYALMGVLALSAGAFLQAQDYDDIYYDASKSATKAKTKVVKPAKTTAVYGEVPEKYKEAVQVNYSADRDIDEYNRRGAYDPSIMVQPSYEIDINGDTIYFDGDTIYEEAFANTRRIERFYNPDIVILCDDDELVELYYDESPTVNLIVGSDWGYGSYYGWGYSSYYPWYTGWYGPWDYGWYAGWHYPWYSTYWYRPWYYWNWGHPHWHYGSSYWAYNHHYWGWDRPAWHGNHGDRSTRYIDTSSRPGGHRTGLATNRNSRGRVDATSSSRNGIAARGANGSRSSSVGNMGSRSRGGFATDRSSSRSSRSSGVSTRSSSNAPSRSGGPSYSGGSHSSSGSSYSGGSRSSGSSSSGSYSGGGSRGGGGGGSHGGSSGGGGRRR